jgi:hypothetical protein
VTVTEFVPTLEALERDNEPVGTIEPTDIAPVTDPRLDPSLALPLVTSVEVHMPTDEVSPTLVILDYIIDPSKPLFEGIDTSVEPHFTVSEAAKFFFRRSSHWLRLQENLCIKCRQPWRTKDPNVCGKDGGEHDIGLIRIDGVRVPPPRTEGGARYYTLADIENTARGLRQQNVIDHNQLSFALAIARLQGRLWDYL